MNTPNALTIGTVAKRAGVPIDTIRYYEREGLLAEPLPRASGYRSYQTKPWSGSPHGWIYKTIHGAEFFATSEDIR